MEKSCQLAICYNFNPKKYYTKLEISSKHKYTITHSQPQINQKIIFESFHLQRFLEKIIYFKVLNLKNIFYHPFPLQSELIQ